MIKLSRVLFAIVVVSVFISTAACSHKAAPTPAPAQPAAALNTPAEADDDEPTPAKVAPASGIDGEWNGNSGEGMALNFTVGGNQVTNVYANFKSNKNGCSSFSSFGSDGPAAISGKAFTAHGKHDQSEFTMTGSFTSDTEASGTIDWKMKTDICGETAAQLKWTAKKGPAPLEDE